MATFQTHRPAPQGLFGLRPKPITRLPLPKRHSSCRATKEEDTKSCGVFQDAGKAVATFAAASCLSLLPLSGAALASEFEVLTTPKPTANYVIDDAKVLNISTEKDLNKRLAKLEAETGYRLEVATVRKLEFETDAFAFGDKLIEKWYPTLEEGTKKGILLVVTTAKDGALTGGPAFLQGVGDDLIDSVISDDIPILTEDELFNKTVQTCASRVEAVLSGKEDPGGPTREEKTRVRTYRTKEETKKVKGATSTIVISLLVIAVVVPMLQYYGYTAKE